MTWQLSAKHLLRITSLNPNRCPLEQRFSNVSVFLHPYCSSNSYSLCTHYYRLPVKYLLLFIHTILFIHHQPRSVRLGRIRPRLGSRCRQERGVIQPPIRHDRSEAAPKLSVTMIDDIYSDVTRCENVFSVMYVALQWMFIEWRYRSDDGIISSLKGIPYTRNRMNGQYQS